MIFTEYIRREIINGGLDNITGTIKEILKKLSLSFAADTEEKLKAGLIRKYLQENNERFILTYV